MVTTVELRKPQNRAKGAMGKAPGNGEGSWDELVFDTVFGEEYNFSILRSLPGYPWARWVSLHTGVLMNSPAQEASLLRFSD
jgi:hypothetical protein